MSHLQKMQVVVPGLPWLVVRLPFSAALASALPESAVSANSGRGSFPIRGALGYFTDQDEGGGGWEGESDGRATERGPMAEIAGEGATETELAFEYPSGGGRGKPTAGLFGFLQEPDEHDIETLTPMAGASARRSRSSSAFRRAWDHSRADKVLGMLHSSE